jgi:predicted alpha/beta hydrolase
MEKVKFKAIDGYELAGIWVTPIEEHQGAIIINAATGVKKEYYLKFAHYLVQNGYQVLLYDYRGIGGSAPADLKGFTATMHEWGTLDMNAALNYVIHEKNADSVIWIGHSIGGQMMGLLEQRHKIKKVIAINCSIGYWRYFTFPYSIMTFLLWNTIGPLLTAIYGYAPMGKMGWGESLPKGVYLEWRKWCLSKKHFTSFLKENYRKATFEDFAQPIIAISSDDDYIANAKTIKHFLAFYPNSPSTITSIDPAQYGIKSIGHTGIFKSKFQHNLWPILIKKIDDNEQ